VTKTRLEVTALSGRKKRLFERVEQPFAEGFIPNTINREKMLRQSEREAMEMKISARNMLKGKVTSVNHGAVNSEVVIELPYGQKIVSVITKASAEGLGLAPGMDAYAVVKATSVMIGVD
jgi:molybdopterin-binding protein